MVSFRDDPTMTGRALLDLLDMTSLMTANLNLLVESFREDPTKTGHVLLDLLDMTANLQ
jgi:hypothetical protein